MPLLNLVGVEKTSGQQIEIAHHLIELVGADDGEIFLPPIDAHPVEIAHDAGSRHDAGAQLIAHRIDIGGFFVIRNPRPYRSGLSPPAIPHHCVRSPAPALFSGVNPAWWWGGVHPK